MTSPYDRSDASDSSAEGTLLEGAAPEGAAHDPVESPATEGAATESADASTLGAHVERVSIDDAERPDAVPSDATESAPPPVSGVPASVSVTEPRPTYLFLGVVAAISLFLDIATKAWAEVTLNRRGFEPLELVDDHLAITLAYNRGGAWGLFQGADEMVRRPFFVIVSLSAILFIVSLYGRLHKSQKALTWGLPLVLGGALGNLSDRITRSQVVDFIDYRADWVLSTNAFVQRYVSNWTITDHWPTFNVADIAICVGVGLMAVDMFTSRKRPAPISKTPAVPSVAAS